MHGPCEHCERDDPSKYRVRVAVPSGRAGRSSDGTRVSALGGRVNRTSLGSPSTARECAVWSCVTDLEQTSVLKKECFTVFRSYSLPAQCLARERRAREHVMVGALRRRLHFWAT